MNRYTARELVTFNPDLSRGARLVYSMLDEYAREKGHCFPSLKRLVERSGIPKRSLQRYIAELAHAGLVTRHRTQPGGGNNYRLYHAPIVAPPSANLGTRVAPPVAPLIRKNTGIEHEEAWRPYEEPEPPTPSTVIALSSDPAICWLCHGRGEAGIGSDRGKCNICTGSGKIKFVKKLA